MTDKEILKDIIRSPKKFIETFVKIQTKSGKLEIMKLNKAQEQVVDYVEECLFVTKKPIRIRILKARQMGFSTMISALGFWWAMLNENSSYAVVAHNADSTQSIFDKNKIIYNNLPKYLKVQTGKFNSETMTFEDSKNPEESLNSKIFFATAGGNEVLRGQTIRFLHKSEKAFWENNEQLNKSLNPAVPNEEGTAIIDESTANGYNHYKKDWDDCVSGVNDYKDFFFGWSFMDEYKMKVEEGFKLLDIEFEYMIEHDLTLEQMRWRRYVITNDYGYNLADIENDDIDDFKQEYPLTPEEAFIASGRSVFNAKVLKKGLEYTSGNKIVSKTYDITSVLMKEQLVMFEEPEIVEHKEYVKRTRRNEETKEWEYYDTEEIESIRYKYAQYVIGVDTSGAGQDNNVISVWNSISKRKVASWKKKNIQEEDLAKVVIEVAKLYHDALIVPEVNFSHSIVNFIVDHNGYKNVYLLENQTRLDDRISLEYGWKTTTKTKPMLVSTMKGALNEDYTIIPDKEFWKEAEYYLQEKSKTGKDTFNAASGKHDDIIMADMIARYICDSFQAKQTYIEKKDKNVYNERKENFLKIGSKSKKNNKYKKGMFSNYA